MISEVLSLGTKGADLMVRQLQKIQKEKKNAMQPAQMRVSMGKQSDKAPSGRDLAENPRATSPAESRMPQAEQPAQDSQKKNTDEKTATETGRAIARGANTIFQGAASLSTSGLISSIGEALGNTPLIGALFVVAATLGNATLTFKDKIKQAAQEFADTADAANTVTNYTSRAGVANSENSNFLRRVRGDINVNEQRGITETLGNQFGRLGQDFQKAVEGLYRGKDGQNYDVRQSTALAQGNFEALGTDQGFFMQKLANGITSLPPSARRALMPQLWQMIPEQDRFRQNDVGARTTNTDFDDQARAQSVSMLNAGPVAAKNIQNALAIQGIQNSIDTGLAAAAGGLITGLGKIQKAIEQMNKNQSAGRPMNEGLRAIFLGDD